MISAALPASGVSFKKAGARETAALLVVSWLIPFLVHMVPWSGERPLGAHLLPMFWATFVAVYFYGAAIGALVGLFAPAVNLILTGFPAWKFFGGMSLELLVFALVSAWAIRRAPRLMFIAPLGYIFAKLIAAVVLLLINSPVDWAASGASFLRSLAGSAAGLAVLLAIDGGLVWFYPKSQEKQP